jgi:hypothetical protein
MIAECTSLDDYMARYGTILGNRTAAAVDPLHKPGRDPIIEVDVLRDPFEAQAHTITACIKQLRRAKTVLFNGECGVGKTMCAMAACHGHADGKPYRAIVMVPPHLVVKWEREIAETIPGAVITVLKTYHDVTCLDRRDKPVAPEWFVVSQTSAKMAPKWKASFNTRKRPIGVPHCPRCGEPVVRVEGKAKRSVPVPPKELSEKRMTCSNEACGEPLWQWVHQPDRWPIAKYVQRRLRHYFDYFICDEVHQAKGEETAIAMNMSRLVSASRKVIALTGTLLGGYANHLRTLLYRLSPGSLIADGLSYDEATKFNERYGRIETTVIDKGGDKWKSNSQSEGRQGKNTRTNRSVKPGVMPSLFGRHLIDKCVFLSLSEVADNLPDLTEEIIPVRLDGEQNLAYSLIEHALTDAIRDMVVRGDRRLLGAMLRTLLGYVDHPYGWDEIGYYERDEASDAQKWIGIVTPPDLPQDVVRPKEQALINRVTAEVEEGRQVWIFTTMTDKHDVVSRLEQLMVTNGFRVKVLRSAVETGDREEWIAAHGPDAEVVISHPALVETGLDLFDKGGTYNFATLMFYQTGYSLFTLRQASRRAWRIGQVNQCRVLYFYYADTMQSRAMTLMGRKLAAAEAVEGKFSAEGLAAMGGEDASMEVALAQSLVHQLDDMEPAREWSKITKLPTGGRNLTATALENLARQRALLLKLDPNTFIRQLTFFN